MGWVLSEAEEVWGKPAVGQLWSEWWSETILSLEELFGMLSSRAQLRE